MPVNAVSLPFREQAEFLRRKINLPTTSWVDIYAAQHDWAFVVAGANRDDLVADFRRSIEQAIDGEITLEGFRKQFDEIVGKHGWSYNGGRNWRTRVIYDTNINTTYMAGRYEQMMAVRNERPYWRYVHSDSVENPRPIHQSWDGLILRWDNPWWQTHFPVNAWGCQCRVEALSERDMQRLGLTESEAPPIELEDRIIGQRSPNGPRTVRVPKGIDPGFEYIPGQSRLHSAVPPESKGGLSSAAAPGVPNTRALTPLPAPRAFPATKILPTGLPPTDYVNAFLREFNATEAPTIFKDAIGERLVISADLFTDRTTGELKIQKRGREQFVLLLAEALKTPDEIWVRLEYVSSLKKAVVRRRYIAQFDIEGMGQAGIAVFETGGDGWVGVTTFNSSSPNYVNDLRHGVRLYNREQ